jgi:SAM-dependent methyltransferase
MTEGVTFSFGENWGRFLIELHPQAVAATVRYFDDWLPDSLEGIRFADVGSGSGLSSLVAYQRGAIVQSFDVDPQSVAATRRLWEQAGKPERWNVIDGSILDDAFVRGVGTYDVVLSWGVLHHTGELWCALSNAASLVAPGGLLWIALYHKTRTSRRSLRLKRTYNRLPDRLKPAFRGLYAAPKLAKMAARRDFSQIDQYHEVRGMSWWRDIEDWLGGLPYEVAAPGEVLDSLHPLGFSLERLASARGEGDNDIYLFKKKNDV